MKSKHTVFWLIVALLTIAVGSYCGEVWAQQQGATKDQVPVVEFSNNLDREAVGGGGAINGLDPLQVLYTEPPDAVGGPRPWNTFDFGETGEVDALANGGDLYLYEVIGNTATLLVSFQVDPGLNAAWFENPLGSTGVQWTQVNLNNPNPAAGADSVEDVDALEVHGPLGADDADFYSMVGDPGGVSVKNMTGGDYIARWQIFSACSTLGYTGSASLIDLDGLMIFEAGGVNGNKIWDSGDKIIFSIKAAGNWDGGEIVVLPFGGPATFLNHGGHIWDTAFGVAAAFTVGTEEVDAIEALHYVDQEYPIPALTEWGLVILVVLLLASAVFIFLRRKKVMVSP